MNEPAERREVYFSGRVQGVGFRYTTREIASRYAVGGYVQNLSDGRVKLIAEGAPAEVSRFIAAVSAEMERYITHVDSHSVPAGGGESHFEIRH